MSCRIVRELERILQVSTFPSFNLSSPCTKSRLDFHPGSAVPKEVVQINSRAQVASKAWAPGLQVVGEVVGIPLWTCLSKSVCG